MARPVVYSDDSVVRLSATGESKLQAKSLRRAIVDYIVDRGGVATLRQIDEYFCYDVRATVQSLVRTGWLELVQEQGDPS